MAPDRPRWPRLLTLTAFVVVGGLLAALAIVVVRWPREDPAEAGARLLERGDYRAAIPLLLRAVAIRDDDPWTHYELGLAYARIGWPEAASKQFTTAAQLAPWSAQFRAALGCAFRDAGDIAAAVKELQQAARLTPEEPRHHLRLAKLLLQMGRQDEALSQLREALRLRPDTPAIHEVLGSPLKTPGDAQRAAEAALRQLDSEGSDWDACAQPEHRTGHG